MLYDIKRSGKRDLHTIEQEQQVYDMVLHEIIRQVYVGCADRAVLLERVSRRYRRLFSSVPGILSDMQQVLSNNYMHSQSRKLMP